MIQRLGLACALAGLMATGSTAWAALPKPTPAQQQEAAAKKAVADAKAAKDKEALAATIDTVSAHWRAQAPAKGWRINPPVAIAAATPIKSEKFGTAALSEDVKKEQTRAVPEGVGPAVEKKSTPATANKK